MALLSATVLRVRPAGKTRDFCPVCRQERRFRLAIAERRRIVLLMDRGAVGQGHHELTCMSCQCKMERPSAERPIGVVPTAAAAETFEPDCLAIVQRRVEDCSAMEAARRANKLTPPWREEMISQALHSFARIYDEEPTERVTPLMSGMILVATLALGAGAALAWLRVEGAPGRAIAAAALVAVLVLWGGLWYWIVTHSPRKKVRTWLAMALAPLDPTVEEIRAARRGLQARRMGAGFKIRSAKVLAKINKLKKSGTVPK